jgi:hypothetical protein
MPIFCENNLSIPWKEDKIISIERLWNPDDTSLEDSKIERELINKNRVNYIKAGKREFRKLFTEGIQKESFSNQ